MSIHIGVNGSYKNVIDVKTGTSSSAFRNIDLVKDWNNKIIWQRNKTKQLTSDNTRFNVDAWTAADSLGYTFGWSRPYKSDTSDKSIEYYNGTSWITLTEGTHYTVKWEDNRVPATGEISSGSATGTGKVYVVGKESGGYSGSFYKEFNISYTYYYQPTTYTISTSASPTNGGRVSGGGSNFKHGSTCTLTAIPSTGYEFEKWGDNTTTNPISFTVTGNATYTAYFKEGESPSIPKITSVIFRDTHTYTVKQIEGDKDYIGVEWFSTPSLLVTFDDTSTRYVSAIDGTYSGLTVKITTGTRSLGYYKKDGVDKSGTLTGPRTATVTGDGTTYSGSSSDTVWSATVGPLVS